MGRVAIVGAGPGDPDLITVRGANLLQEADVILYDRLVPRELLRRARSGCELIYVGKEPGRHAMSQEEIVRLMIERAREEKLVVRLHGGDPFLFGRGFEEYVAVVREGIPCEVVPGITSAIAVPERYGIPLTLRGVSSSIAIVTGTEDLRKGRTFVDLRRIAQAVDTIVILMGARRLVSIARELMEAGLSDDTPIAVLRAFLGEPLRAVMTLREVVEREPQFESPVVIVVGRVVSAALELMGSRAF